MLPHTSVPKFFERAAARVFHVQVLRIRSPLLLMLVLRLQFTPLRFAPLAQLVAVLRITLRLTNAVRYVQLTFEEGLPVRAKPQELCSLQVEVAANAAPHEDHVFLYFIRNSNLLDWRLGSKLGLCICSTCSC